MVHSSPCRWKFSSSGNLLINEAHLCLCPTLWHEELLVWCLFSPGSPLPPSSVYWHQGSPPEEAVVLRGLHHRCLSFLEQMNHRELISIVKKKKKRQIDSEVLIFPENKPTFVFVFLLLFSSFWFVLHLPLSHLGQSGLQHGLSFLLQSFSFTALLCCLRKATGLGLTKTWMFYLDDIIVHIQQSEKSWFVQSQSQSIIQYEINEIKLR